MEELKLLIEMVSHLPSMALWVLAGFFAYKVVCIGSIYGVVRLAIIKAHDWLTKPKIDRIDLRVMLDGLTIQDALEPLITQIKRIQNHNGPYIRRSDVAWLEQAITEKRDREKNKE